VVDEVTEGTGSASRSPGGPDELNAPEGSRAIDPSEAASLRPNYGTDRFSPSMTEEDLAEVAQQLFPGRQYDPATQGRIVFSGGRPVRQRVRGSTVPDLYLSGTRRTRPVSLEAKNYFLGDEQAYFDFMDAVIGQGQQRAAALPRTAQQHLVIDLRGQEVTRAFADGVRRDLVAFSDGLFRYDRIHFLPWSLN